jgi:hypothetical protein
MSAIVGAVETSLIGPPNKATLKVLGRVHGCRLIIDLRHKLIVKDLIFGNMPLRLQWTL